MSEPFLGQITLFPYSFPPKNWADCQGQILPIAQYSALFSLLGVQFGGDGRSNFGLPNLQGAISVGQGQLPGGSLYTIGETAGSAMVTLDSGTMPVHSHSMNAKTADGTTNSPVDAVLANVYLGDFQGANQGNVYNPANPNTALQQSSIGPVGGNQPHNNLQPYLALRYCIALAGIFPSRS